MRSCEAASKRQVKERRLRTLLLNTPFDREISDDESAQNIDGSVMEEDNLKTGISDITTILASKLLTHQTEA